MTTTADTTRGRMYWGGGALPQGASILGTVRRTAGDTGALLRMPTGRLEQGNAGTLRTLPRDVTPPKGNG
jgi:hypothetical protein